MAGILAVLGSTRGDRGRDTTHAHQALITGTVSFVQPEGRPLSILSMFGVPVSFARDGAKQASKKEGRRSLVAACQKRTRDATPPDRQACDRR